MTGPLVFRTRTPAPRWEDGLIAGSGRVGALVHGSADALRISLAHERFFLPANPRPAAPDLRAALPDLRAAVDERDAGESASTVLRAALTAAGYDGLVWTDPLGLCAVLSLSTPGGASEVERTVDLERGVATVSWLDDGGAQHRAHTVAVRDTDTVLVALESDVAVGITVRVGLELDDDAPAASFAPDYSGVVEGHPHAGPPAHLDVSSHDGSVLATSTVTSDDSAAWQVRGRSLEAVLDVPAGGRRTVRLDVAVTGHRPRPAGAGTVWRGTLDAQERTHGALVRRSLLDLGTDDAHRDDSVEDLWARARGGDAAAIRRAVSIAYAAGRTNIIAATGELPATLQGVWQGTWKPAWSADYTMNGNVQNGTVAALLSTGTPELMRSVAELVLDHLDDYRDNARRVFDADGMLLPARMSTHGIANHANADFPHLFWVGAGGWALRLIADLVSTTGDRTVVDDRVWELAEGVLRFAETATTTGERGRRLIPGYSPENTPAGAASPLAADATMDVAILRDAARATRLLGAARGDDSLDGRWASVTADLPAFRVAADGTLAEWLDPRFPENLAHRHVSQLYPLWYEPDPAFTGDSPAAAQLRAAARATIDAKIAWRAADPTAPPGRMEMAFGLAQLGLAAAALGEADAARTCAEWLALLHWRPALTTTHDAGAIFNLDASGALPAVVAAMLVGSTSDTVTLLPALPRDWPSGEVTGLRARGGIVVDRLRWDEHGATALLRRLPEAEWLRPAAGTRVIAGPGFSLSDVPARIDAAPTEIKMERVVADTPPHDDSSH